MSAPISAAMRAAERLSASRPGPESGGGGGGALLPPGEQIGGDVRGHPGGRLAHPAAREMGVAGRGLHPRVAEQPGDGGQALAERQRARGEGVAQIVQAHVVEPGLPAHKAPLQEDARQRRPRLAPRHDIGVLGDPRQPRKDRRRLGRERHGSRPGLGIAQGELHRLDPHLVPAQPQDLVPPAAGERQQPDRRRRARRAPAARLQPVQRRAEPAELGIGEKALAPPRAVFRDRAGRVLARRQPPIGGVVDQPGQHGDRLVGRRRAVGEAVLQRRRLGAADCGDREPAQRRQDVAVDRHAVLRLGRRLAAQLDMVAQIAPGDLGHRGRAAGRGGEQGRRLAARALGRHRAVPPERDAPRPARPGELHHVCLAPRRLDHDAEPGQLAVAEHGALARAQRLDGARRQPARGHGGPPPRRARPSPPPFLSPRT